MATEETMNQVRYYETFEIKDDQNRQILPPNLIVDKDFKIDGGSSYVHIQDTNRYTLISQESDMSNLDDKDEYTCN